MPDYTLYATADGAVVQTVTCLADEISHYVTEDTAYLEGTYPPAKYYIHLPDLTPTLLPPEDDPAGGTDWSLLTDIPANLSALAELVGAADKVAYFTGLGTMALASLTSFGRSLVAAVDAAAGRTALGLGDSATKDVGTGAGDVAAGNAPAAALAAAQAYADGLVVGAPSTRAGLPREIWIDAGALVPRTSNGPATATVELSTNKQNFDCLDFDASAAEYAQFKLSLPEQWGAGTVKARIFWTAASGSGAVVWAVQGVACSDGDAMDASWGTAVTVTDTLLSANDCHIATTGTITIGGSPAVADLVYFQVYRDATSGSDTLAVDARLLGIKLQYVESSTEASAW